MKGKGYCLKINPDEYLLGKLLGFINSKITVEHPPIDPDQPYEPAHTGIFAKTLDINGTARNMLTYVPPHFPTSGAGLFVFLDDGAKSQDAFVVGNWQNLSDQHGIAIILLEASASGWDKDNIQTEIDFAEKAFQTSIARDLYSMNESTYYAAGFGAGAYPMIAFSMLYSSVFSGFVADGDCALHPELLEQLRNLPSDGDRTIKKGKVKLPAWIIDRTGDSQDILSYLKTANDVDGSPLHNGFAQVYQQNKLNAHAWINGLPIAEVWHSTAADVADLDAIAENEQIIRFLMRTKRWMSGNENNGDLRPARTPQDMGLKRFDLVVDGRKRHWYIYEPSVCKKNPDKKYPLVLAIHGYSCTGKLYAENSEWHVVAEKRGFIVAYPTAYPGMMGGSCTPLPLWNCEQFVGETGIDDVKFLLTVIAETKKQYAVDESRIYAAGHSNGSAMTQLLLQKVPLVFAAFGPVGYTFGELTVDPNKPRRMPIVMDQGVRRPVWLMKGTYDVGCAADLSPESVNTQVLAAYCQANQIDVNKKRVYENGEYIHHTYYSDENVPLVKFTEIVNLPHAYSPEMALMTWDDFFCRFRRTADGEIEYLG